MEWHMKINVSTDGNGFSKNLFWDADLADLDFAKHKKYIVQRVLERGALEDVRYLFRLYGKDDVLTVSKSLRTLEPRALSFISNLSGEPRGNFRCYTKNQSCQAPWIY